MKKQYLLKLEEELLAELKRLAAADNRSLNNFINTKLAEVVEVGNKLLSGSNDRSIHSK